MDHLANLEIIEKVVRYQNDPHFHPLTCPRDECGDDLVAQERNGKVILTCPSCYYVQEEIPDCILTFDYLKHEVLRRICRDEEFKRWLSVVVKAIGK